MLINYEREMDSQLTLYFTLTQIFLGGKKQRLTYLQH